MLTSAKLTALGRKVRDLVCFMTSLSQNKKNHLLIVTNWMLRSKNQWSVD